MAPLAYVRFREALDRLCVRLNMYLVLQRVFMSTNCIVVRLSQS